MRESVGFQKGVKIEIVRNQSMNLTRNNETFWLGVGRGREEGGRELLYNYVFSTRDSNFYK